MTIELSSTYSFIINMDIAIIGGGAAGMMCAATLAEKNSGAKIFLIEKNAILGRKVMISGGGRCNITTGISDVPNVLTKYPRGKNFLKFAMYNFPPDKVFEWFENHGVPLKTEKDLRVFPKSNNGNDVVNIFEDIFKINGVKVLLRHNLAGVKKNKEFFELEFADNSILIVDKLVLTTGGEAYRHTGSSGDGYSFAKKLGHTITDLAPSLNAFVLKENWIRQLAGVSFKDCKLRICTRLRRMHEFCGDFIFTHKGVSGPAVFALSSLAAYELKDPKREVKLLIDFFPEINYEKLKSIIVNHWKKNPGKFFVNILDSIIPLSLAKVLCDELKIRSDKNLEEIAKTELNRSVEFLKNMMLPIVDRAAGEEFVTAGGINLKDVDAKTMQSKICPGLYFAGEILDMDGFTGGFNLQAAWATGRLAGSMKL